MIHEKNIWNFHKDSRSRKQRFAQTYKTRLISSTVPAKNSKKQVLASNPNTNRCCKFSQTQTIKPNRKISSCNKKKRVGDVSYRELNKDIEVQNEVLETDNLNHGLEQISFTTKQTETAKQLRFLMATKKLFRSLDFFNKGFIGEANIDKWMPESALYFLGNVFLKIRR